jgi:hypothetical protein
MLFEGRCTKFMEIEMLLKQLQLEKTLYKSKTWASLIFSRVVSSDEQ